jgi:iron only hydrogenase large subunit-like protein
MAAVSNAMDIILCLNPKCRQLAYENVHMSFGTCTSPKCMTVMQAFGCQEMISTYNNHIVIYKQAPEEYASNFKYIRDFFRHEIEKNLSKPLISPSISNAFRPNNIDNLDIGNLRLS